MISPSFILNNCADTLAYLIWKRMHKSLDKEILPTQWKKANITPVYKTGDKSLTDNYGPVVLTSVICKLGFGKNNL